ncbi:hypothetical protein HMSSN036_53140 [Paenibacillus macerans]|nr:hypothetical protein HMSSN036_53140 [Paenibacillus macerans]
MYPTLIDVKESWDKLSELLFALMPERSDAAPGDPGQFVYRLLPLKKPQEWDKLLALENQIYVSLGDVLRKGDRMLAQIREEQEDYGSESLLTDINGLFKDLANEREALRFFMKLESEETVYWMEANGNFRSRSLQMYAVPIDVSAQLKEYFFDRKKRGDDLGDAVGRQVVPVYDRTAGTDGSGRGRTAEHGDAAVAV